MTDPELILLVKNSAEKGYCELVRQYGNYAYAIASNNLRTIASQSDIDDCVVDSLVYIVQNIEKYEPSFGSLRSYIATVTSRNSIDAFRKLSKIKKRTVYIDDEDTPDLISENDTEAETEKHLESSYIWQKVAELGEPDSTILIQQYFYGTPVNEIAKLVSMSVHAVNKRSQRARKKLKEILFQTE